MRSSRKWVLLVMFLWMSGDIVACDTFLKYSRGGDMGIKKGKIVKVKDGLEKIAPNKVRISKTRRRK